MTNPLHSARRPEPARDDTLERALADEREALKALFPLPPPTGRTPRPGSTSERPARAVSAAIVGAVALAGLLWLDPSYRTEQHATAIGERRTVELADGSRLTLDTATRVQVSWHLRSRRSELDHGRVSYAVAPATLRPFEVRAHHLRVHVVGTVFDVRREGRNASVTVLEGRVRVETSMTSGVALLVPGDHLASTRGEPEPPVKVDVGSVTAWQQGRLVFERTPLLRALEEIQRYRREPLRLHDAALGALEISGVFDADNTDQLLTLLPKVLPLRVVHADDGGVDIMRR